MKYRFIIYTRTKSMVEKGSIDFLEDINMLLTSGSWKVKDFSTALAPITASTPDDAPVLALTVCLEKVSL